MKTATCNVRFYHEWDDREVVREAIEEAFSGPQHEHDWIRITRFRVGKPRLDDDRSLLIPARVVIQSRVRDADTMADLLMERRVVVLDPECETHIEVELARN